MQDGGQAYIAMFMVVIVPPVVHLHAEQQWIQLSFVTVSYGYLDDWYRAAAYGADEPLVLQGPVNDVPLAKPSSIIQVTMTCVFASLQCSVPTIGRMRAAKLNFVSIWTSSALSYVSNLFWHPVCIILWSRSAGQQ
jgi:hypothetical protein